MNASASSEVLKLVLLLCMAALFTVVMPRLQWPTRFCRVNAFGTSIPVTFGLVPALALSSLMLFGHPSSIAACLLILGFCLIGFLDDTFGSGAYRGIRGHLNALRKRIVTTGLIKLLASPVMAATYAFVTYGTDNWLSYLYITMIAASSNVFNLLDLRPGRSQGFAILTLLAILPIFHTSLILGAIMILAVTIVPDARAKVMMGDAGAIAIGCAVALVVIASSNITLSVTYTLAAVFLNLLAERYSLGKLIAHNAVLSKLDGLMGRRS